ncbi:NitT/TauT family transport system substrate-binding protein [Anaerocolumna jejuensis DSM 15929]|uniref:NitT/TauT family transport system substrate-binding protein n=1 Tax=Anaerocolumna jejuensis DSM 15929 TaxID=1121322 RepID=A0A1M6NL89_9FIRM|nr:ABC transporter substrate-binding protein [Anaerocolumna jejuensis]SHJ96485.1 NitT/TauT family transport system substrate-binding protein [Anaerocolumna jejuensis DSM 15929]
MKKLRKPAGLLVIILTVNLLLAACSGKPVEVSKNTAGNGEGSSNSTPAATTAEASKDTPAETPTAAPVNYKYGKIDIPGKDGALCGAPIYIAYEKGFFAEEGFDVNLISANAEARKIGLNNGTIPIVNGDFQFFPSIENDVKVKVVDGLHNGCIKLLVKKDSPINGVKDLKGLKIGVDEIGGTPHQVASVWLEKNGISAKPEDGEVKFLPFDDGNLEVEALNKGDIDVAALWDPFGSVQEKTGNYKVIFDLSTDPTFAGKYCCFLYASEKVLDENPEKVAALLRAYHKAQNWIAENPEEAVQTIIDGKYSAIEDKELAVELVKHYQYPSMQEHEMNKHDVGADVLYFATELYNIGYLNTNPDEFAKKAYQKVDLTLGQ